MDFAKGKVFIFSAPSGAGKTTIVQHILDQYPEFEFSVSATTRKARDHEQHGVHYYFLDEAGFKQKIEEGDFLEWQEVYPGRFYGSLKSDVERIRRKGHHVAFDVDVKGGMNIKGCYGNEAVSFFIQPPDLKTLKKRLLKRATESPAEIAMRLRKATLEMSFARQFDHIILNDDLDAALRKVRQIIDLHLQKA